MDLYTKFILTVIAICLVILVFKPVAVPPVFAGNNTLDINISSVGGRSVYNAIPVKTVNN